MSRPARYLSCIRGCVRVLGRREFCLLASAGVLRGANRIPVALQLFSVREQCERDLPGTLSQVAAIGYEGVELAGTYGHAPDHVRALLNERRLQCCAAHVTFESLLGAELQRTIDFHKALGNRNLIVPGLPEQATRSRQSWLATAGVFTETAHKLQQHGLRLGYHNHALEFKPLDNELPWITFFRNTPREVFIELDLGNAGYGGADPVAMLKRFPGRTRFVHVKDYTAKEADLMIGAGVMNWREFFPICQTVAGTDWFVIEHDSDPAAHLADIRESLQRFRAKRDQKL
jgi:sugar phosphate isomerase/epimerase